MIRNPSLLLMDEPMSNLDAKLRTQLRAELKALQRELAITTVYVTHDQVEAMALGDRAAVMRSGRIVQCAPPIELYERPIDVFVAGFIGMPPMNIVAARVVPDDRGGVALTVGAHRWTASTIADRWPQLGEMVGATIAVGFRPEAVSLVHHDLVAAPLTVEIRSSEWLGADHYVAATCSVHAVGQTGDRPFVAVEPAATVVAAFPNDVVPDLWRPTTFSIDVDQLHLFELEFGCRLARRARRQPTSNAGGYLTRPVIDGS